MPGPVPTGKGVPETLQGERRLAAHLLETVSSPEPDTDVFEELLTLKAFNDGKRDQASHIYGMYDEETRYLDQAIRILTRAPSGTKGPLGAENKSEYASCVLLQRKYGRNMGAARELAKKLKIEADYFNEKLLWAGFVAPVVVADRERAGTLDMFGAVREFAEKTPAGTAERRNKIFFGLPDAD